MWAPMRATLAVGTGANDTNDRLTSVPPELLVQIIATFANNQSASYDLCKSVYNIMNGTKGMRLDNNMWRQVVQALHLPPGRLDSVGGGGDGGGGDGGGGIGGGGGGADYKNIFLMWCDHTKSSYQMSLIVCTWVKFLMLYRESGQKEMEREASVSLLFCLDNYGEWSDIQSAIDQLCKVVNLHLLKWLLYVFFVRNWPGKKNDLLGRALSAVFFSDALIPKDPKDPENSENAQERDKQLHGTHKNLFEAIIDIPFNFTLAYVTRAMLTATTRMYTAAYKSGRDIDYAYNEYLGANDVMIAHWNNLELDDKLQALRELIREFDHLFDHTRDLHRSGEPWDDVKVSPAHFFCVPLHFFLRATGYFAEEEFFESEEETERGPWRALVMWSQTYVFADGVLERKGVVPNWFTVPKFWFLGGSDLPASPPHDMEENGDGSEDGSEDEYE
jgi:hypothetical protein